MERRVWVRDPHSGGRKVPPTVQARTRARILAHAAETCAGGYTRIDVRFRGKFCYIDAYTEPTLSEGWPPPGHPETREECLKRMRSTPTHLCRLRFFSEGNWSLAFYTYSDERYKPCMFRSGEWWGTPEEGFDVGSVYIQH